MFHLNIADLKNVVKAKLIGVLLLLLFISYHSFSQKKTTVDSLLNIANGIKKQPIKRIDALTKLAKLYYRTDSAKTYNYALKAKLEAEKAGYKMGIADAISAMAMYHSSTTNFNKTILLFDKANAIYNSINEENKIATNYNYIGTMYKLVNKYNEALAYSKKAEQVHRRNKNLSELVNDLIDIGSIYSETDRKKEALNYYYEALNYNSQLNDETQRARLLINTANILREQKNYSEASKYYDKAIYTFNNVNDKVNVGIANVNLAIVYAEQFKYTQAISTIEKAVDAFIVAKFDRGVIFGYNNIGGIYLRKGDYTNGLSSLQKAKDASIKSNNFSLMATILENQAYALTKLGRYKEAEKLFIEAENEARKNNNRTGVFGNIYDHWSMLDSAQNNFKEAYFHRRLFTQIKDSTQNATLSKQVNELQIKYETERKERQIENLSRENTINQLELNKTKLENSNKQLALNTSELNNKNKSLQLKEKESQLVNEVLRTGAKQQEVSLLSKENIIQKLAISQKNTLLAVTLILFFAIIIIGFLFYNRYKLKQETILAQEKAAQRELITKAVIDAEENERKRIASDLHDGVGQMFSAVKMNLNGLLSRIEMPRAEDQFLAEKTLALVDESCKEVRVISHKMMPNFLLKSGIAADIKSFIDKIDAESLKINFETEGFGNQLEYNEEVILYRVIQELVNNVIKHSQANTMSIALKKSKSHIYLALADNGNGFDYSKIEQFEGLGLKNLKIRVDYLKGIIKYGPNNPKGTKVTVEIPIV